MKNFCSGIIQSVSTRYFCIFLFLFVFITILYVTILLLPSVDYRNGIWHLCKHLPTYLSLGSVLGDSAIQSNLRISPKSTRTTQQFYCCYTDQPMLAGTPVKNQTAFFAAHQKLAISNNKWAVNLLSLLPTCCCLWQVSGGNW